MANVDIYLDSRLRTADIAEFGADHVVVACGSQWRRDGLGHHLRLPLPDYDAGSVFTPDDICVGAELGKQVLIYDDDHYFTGGALAERLLQAGHRVRYLTPATTISSWSAMTDEQDFIQHRLLSMGIETAFSRVAESIAPGRLTTRGILGGESRVDEFDSLLLVTSRAPENALYGGLAPGSATRIGDCLVPSSIADAVYSGHRFAREFGEDPPSLVPRRERSRLSPLSSRENTP
jgi:dimethylamine/trimethylamine dehydrogenase